MHRHCAKLVALAAGFAVLLAGAAARADVFELKNQGMLKGQLLNPDEKPRKKYVIRSTNGAIVTLERDQVAKMHRETAKDLEYEKRMPTYADTVAAQWSLSEWCRENKLNIPRQRHLNRVIELDPNHKQARRALGYIEIDGAWKTQAQAQVDRGMIRYEGAWRLPQEIEVLEKQRKNQAAEKDWFAKIRRLRGAVANDRSAEAAASLRSIQDPYAIKALAAQLQEEQDQRVRVWYLESLSKIPSPDATTLLVGVALHDRIEEVRLSALDFLVENPNPEVPAMFIAALRSEDLEVIKRASVALGRIKHPAAVGPLIDALVVVQKIETVQGQEGGVGATFGKGPGNSGGGLSVGQQVATQYIQHNNLPALDALSKITGQTFEFNVPAWKAWFAQQKKPETLDGRRG